MCYFPKDDTLSQSEKDAIKYAGPAKQLYYDVYRYFTNEIGIICSINDFQSIIDEDNFYSELIPVLLEHGAHSKEAHAKVLGLVIPAAQAYTDTTGPAGMADSMFNIAKVMFPHTSMQATQFAKMFGVDLDDTVEALADAIGEGMKTINIPPGANIFNRGGRGTGRTNDEGELVIDPIPPSSQFYHHEPVKNELNWDLGLDNTMQGTAPFWKSDFQRTCFVGKFNMMQFPNDDAMLREYYEQVLVPVLRNSVQANKRYTANVGTFFTYTAFKVYINEVIQAVAIYYFFANGFAYCNQPGLVNNNEALRHLRQDLFSTAQLQRFQQLGQLIDSLPIPQTLINGVAQYHGWYSNSTEANATLYCNIPHGVFEDNTFYSSTVDSQGALNSLQSDVILSQITKLTGPISGTTQENTDKFLGLLLNTIPGWRNSTVGGSAFSTDLYDEAHWNEFLNSPTVCNIYLGQQNEQWSDSLHLLHPQWDNDDEPYRYRSVGDKVPGYLQAYFTPLEYDGTNYSNIKCHGIIKPQPRTTKFTQYYGAFSAYKESSVFSNIMVWQSNGVLYDKSGNSLSKGFVLFPTFYNQQLGSNIGHPYKITIDSGIRTLGPTYATAYGDGQEVPGAYSATNMSVNQCTPNRLLAVQKLLDVQDFYEISNPTANKEKSFGGGRRGRRGRKGSKPEAKVEEDVKAKEAE